MFHSIRRHQKWLWAVITTLTIVSFVVFFSPKRAKYDKSSLFRSEAAVGSMKGRPISRDEYIDAYREVELRYLFSTGNWPRNDEMTRQLGIMERETKNRLLLVEKMKEFNIQVSESSVAQWIAEAFKDRENYDGFIKRRLPEQNLAEADLERYVRHEVGIQHLVALTGLNGKMVTPQEAEIVFRRENEQVDTQIVFLQSTNYLTKVVDNPADLMAFYTNRQANYRIPDRVQVVYVKFEATNYLAEADQKLTGITNLNQRIEDEYTQRGAASFKDANNQPLSPEAAKLKIREDSRQGLALTEARKKAIEFANELLDLPSATNNLANLAAAKGVISKVTDPFQEDGQPPDLKVPDNFVRAAFQLSPAQPFYEQPLAAEDGIYLIGFHSRIPSEVRPFETVREKITEDYRKNKATELLNAAGRELHTTLTNGLAQGKTFEAICTEANAPAIDLPAFSQKTTIVPQIQNRGDLSAIKTAAFGLTPSQFSAFTPTRDGGFIVYLQAKVPVAETTVKAELPQFIGTLRRDRQFEAYGAWVRKELETARITLPGDKQASN